MSFEQPLLMVKSPCVRNCCLDADDICLGCGRSLPEIVSWGSADDTTRKAILASAKARKRIPRNPAN